MPVPCVPRSADAKMQTSLLLATCAVVGLVVLLVPACGGVATIPSDGPDASVSLDGATAADGASAGDAVGTADGGCCPALDAGTFCTGDKPRLFVNGAEVAVMRATGKSVVLNCCDSAEVTVASSAFQALLNVVWRAPAGGGATGTLDLSKLPGGGSVELDLGCDPTQTTCGAGAEDRYTSGFRGTITHTTDASGQVATYCMAVDEPPGSPHPVLHSIQLYAPKVPSP